jgi:hypothetical protein
VEIQLGEKTIAFKPDRRGAATAADGTFRVKNASQYGVVYGGMMEFEAMINGVEWWQELQKAGVPASGTATVPVAVTMRVGPAQHTAPASLTLREK